ncbi:M23 family metallopeptidase [Candidatus Mycobacterium methanotrophicum]|uniref:M23 family metallopeptidase n=1 Tax=Candidatus Mycobacterium methanotrophicum TaxID=2943498 RepID=A0ABY4QQF1_9MYCO|nr:M23 family metallopeptidase [Candidatus Mycobacterium methanotrophicum]UQX12111.1 M23 family metallopeptidase [Candidatus Mycobacterium methanotrophicum]
MTQLTPARSPAPRRARQSPDREWEPNRNEVTDIIPFNEFGDLGNLDDLDFSDNCAFPKEAQVLQAPELDDLDDADNLAVLTLTGPSVGEPSVASPARRADAYRHERRSPRNGLDPVARRGQHRKQLTGPARGRVLIGAMAAGAAVAAAYTGTHTSDHSKAQTVLAAAAATMDGGAVSMSARGMQMVTVQPAANVAVHNAELAKGVAFAQERAQREARLAQPLFVMPTTGIFTSGFGYRWGVLHAGIDIANSIGTPIRAVSDGVVIDAGPTAGYGMWVKLRHVDGTVTLYGHINSTMVSVGERVLAGDQIAIMGNRGNSTGPHLHFEVLLGGGQRIDPVPWLAKRGLSVGTFAG